MSQSSSVILITGAARRLGRADGAAPVRARPELGDSLPRLDPEAQAVARECRERGADAAEVFPADLSSVAETEALVRRVAERFGRLDALVNNASTYFPSTLADATEEQFDSLMDVNAKAAFFASRVAADIMERTAGGGVIVNMADASWERPWPSYIPYMMAKAAVVCLTRGMARALGPKNIRVNVIAPGSVLPPEDADAEAIARSVRRAPMGRLGSPEDIAEAVEFLIFRAPYITGAVLPVDGGRAVGG